MVSPSSESSSSGLGSRTGGFGFLGFGSAFRRVFVAFGGALLVVLVIRRDGGATGACGFASGPICGYCARSVDVGAQGALTRFMSNVESIRCNTKCFFSGLNTRTYWPSPVARTPWYVYLSDLSVKERS